MKKKAASVPAIKVLWEDKDYAGIYKPAGLIVHPDGKNNEKALTDWILKKYPKTKNVGEPIELQNGEQVLRPGIVHRIDRETSGVLIIAKNQPAYMRLKRQFKRHEVRKIYHAFVYGTLPDKEGRITKPIARSSSDFRRFNASRGGRGEAREALTYYRVLKNFSGGTFTEVRPFTGRTHQIRVHFEAIGHPVIADSLYAPSKRALLGFKRLALHAREIQFHDFSGEKISVVAPYPKDFESAVKKVS